MRSTRPKPGRQGQRQGEGHGRGQGRGLIQGRGQGQGQGQSCLVWYRETLRVLTSFNINSSKHNMFSQLLSLRCFLSVDFYFSRVFSGIILCCIFCLFRGQIFLSLGMRFRIKYVSFFQALRPEICSNLGFAQSASILHIYRIWANKFFVDLGSGEFEGGDGGRL